MKEGVRSGGTRRRYPVWGAALLGAALLAVLALKLPPLAHLMDGPAFCGLCHVMQSQVDSYLHAAHREAASCGDCHLPHDPVWGAFYKAYTGTRDVVAVAVLAPEETSVALSPLGARVVHGNCRRCHGEMTALIGDTARDGGTYCFTCHRYAPHR
ncbi:MAG: NapC/NirT family cytochrome c [Bacillota bacterium]